MTYKEMLNKIKGDEWYNYMDDAISMLAEYDSEYGGLAIVSYDLAEQIAKEELDRGGLLRLAYFIGQAEVLNDEYYRLDGYGNLVNIKKSWVEMTLEEIANEGK